MVPPGEAASAGVTRAELQQLVPLLRAGQYPEIERRARALIDRDPACGGAWKALGVALELQQQDAQSALQRAVVLLPGDAEAHAALGTTLLRQGRALEAVASFRRSLDLRPDDPETHSNLGNALRAAGRLEEALGAYRSAARLAPGRAEFHGNVARALWLQHRPQEAAGSFRAALALQPDAPEYLGGLAMALAALGRPQEALAPAQRAAALAPQSSDAFNALGAVLLDLGREQEAEPVLRAALELRPQFAEAWGNLAMALRLQGRTEQAIEATREALALAPRSTDTLVALADALADQGAFEQAERQLREALALDPDCAPACAAIAHLRRMTRADAPWLAQALRIAASERLAPRSRIQLHYAIGKYYDDLQEYESAFAQYRQANEISKHLRVPYDRAAWEAEVDRLIRTYDMAWMQGIATPTAVSARPVFIVGMPRSGTSLIEQILATHPLVRAVGELPFWNLAAAEDAPTAAAAAAAAPRLGQDYLQQLEKFSPGATRVVDKMPDNFRHLGLIHAALPAARIIHVRRHPVDTCLSIYFQDFKAGLAYATDLGSLAHHYSGYRRLMQHWRSVLPTGTLFEIPYEALVADQEGWTRRLLDFLELPWDPACLDFHDTRRSVVTASRWQVRQRLSAASVGRWRHYEAFVAPLRSLLDGADAAAVGVDDR